MLGNPAQYALYRMQAEREAEQRLMANAKKNPDSLLSSDEKAQLEKLEAKKKEISDGTLLGWHRTGSLCGYPLPARNLTDEQRMEERMRESRYAFKTLRTSKSRWEEQRREAEKERIAEERRKVDSERHKARSKQQEEEKRSQSLAQMVLKKTVPPEGYAQWFPSGSKPKAPPKFPSPSGAFGAAWSGVLRAQSARSQSAPMPRPPPKKSTAGKDGTARPSIIPEHSAVEETDASEKSEQSRAPGTGEAGNAAERHGLEGASQGGSGGLGGGLRSSMGLGLEDASLPRVDGFASPEPMRAGRASTPSTGGSPREQATEASQKIRQRFTERSHSASAPPARAGAKAATATPSAETVQIV